MNKIPDSLPKQPELKAAEDYYRLRREGIGFIEQMGSRLWTDYNTHDPGITILENLCYAITDLAYRSGWPIADLLTPASPPADAETPFPDQAFFTARDILTVNPLTPDDFHRLLIDLEPVRNAWVFCKDCACGFSYYAWCQNDQLQLSYQKPDAALHPKRVEPQGLYEVLLELEADPELGDLNDRKIRHAYSVFDAEGDPHPTAMEMRFPDWQLANPGQGQLFIDSGDAFSGLNGASFTVNVSIGATKTYDVLTDPLLDDAGRDKYLRDHWRQVWYVRFELELLPGGEKISIGPAALRVFGDVAAKNQATAAGMKALFEDTTSAGFIRRYRNKLIGTQAAVGAARDALQKHRNLDEDYCRIRLVDIEDVSVCADVETKPDADIERIQAEIWLAVERYFNPPVPFYSLQELLADGTPVEDIFNGPALSNGFIKNADLEASGLKTVLRVSDLINSLMDIDGVIAVNNLLLSKYDAEGNIVKGAADPGWASDGSPVFDSDKISAAWLLYISPLHQPRFHRELSRFLFFKNGLPFAPRQDEAYDTLIQLRGEMERPKINNTLNDLPIPEGTFRDPEAYFPLQYGFPLTYGIGPEGLPSHASSQRKAQARQLKAYLLVFEQLIANALAQIAHTADLFSLDPATDRTYFFKVFSESVIKGYDELTDGLGTAELEAMTETKPEFHERRNRFLDHLMARFGEQFGEYALLLSRSQGQAVQDRLIKDKLAFLTAYPGISHDRGKAFNYTLPVSQDNPAGIKKRVSLLLGFPDLVFSMDAGEPAGSLYTITYQLVDAQQHSWFAGSLVVDAGDDEDAKRQAWQELLAAMSNPAAYDIAPEAAGYLLKLKDADDNPLGQSDPLASESEAEALKTELLGWSANERAIVVEHLLLRPKFPGDALYPACVSGGCGTCGDEDPYSFRLTWVMPGWTAPHNDNMDLRGFADRTIRRETPAHLLAKICWVGNDGFTADPCDPIVGNVAELLSAASASADEEQACGCATALYQRFSDAFRLWYQDKILHNFQPDELKAELQTLFDALDANGLDCAVVIDDALWQQIVALMLDYFQPIALTGWQFERFENAWRQWLEANARIDWTEERLPEQLHAILSANLLSASAADLCRCSAGILSAYGTAFYQWMSGNVQQGRDFGDLTDFQPIPISLREEGDAQAPAFCADAAFRTGTAAAVQTLLDERYAGYREVSFRLWQVVNLLAGLRNVYPDATLHDCDDGSDQNPVRLGSTALGSLHARQPAQTL
jgi:hypothetical protein